MLRFDGKVALVTGGGRGLGRSHALLLAARGAAVLVNDLGGDPTGSGSSPSPADEVVAEITAAGGTAAANHDDVAADAEAVVRAAIDAFGKLDIVVNNAGINVPAPIGSAGAVHQIRRQMEVNFFGTAAIAAAAWPHLAASGSGRIVNTSSPTIVGWEGQTPYVTSKAAVFGFTRCLALEGKEAGIRVNAIAPTAYTRLAEEADIPDSLKETLKEKMTPSMASQLVAYFAHEDCAVTGETILTQGGHMQRIALTMNEGYTNPDTTPEDIAEHLAAIVDDATSKPLGIVGSEGEVSLLDIV
ncbi:MULTISPECIES: SDR family NAD(P)-dependent oxidoreductase [Amycolatopsis]|uniref:SDR family NAD(P)-dependent oxidoreductase n=1 Tax=Amycolatopsis dendrobii TaxID=2760662 RepID=A0A7W3ZEH9_9PSEU|nr:MULTISPECIES: SDR family NAD(P)-dependent oxidoreductase [Amycolatopsis]MBB1158067.1 SDR family NAD(P)-dependent oxidoreductase [Amycolatopsis dendrobii]UKD57139.1 SDR family NAD(P)-dependent oxidoreductase [Amycolatopsis sp. FU40]